MMQAIKKYAVLKGIVDQCDDVVRAALERNAVREANIALESFNNGGKRLRPALLVLSSMLPGGDKLGKADDALIDLAGAVELVHLATLFHDDVIDEVDHRRTKLSARLKYGNYASVLTGDFALAEALDLVQRSGHPEAMPEFIRTLRVLVRGESIEQRRSPETDRALQDAAALPQQNRCVLTQPSRPRERMHADAVEHLVHVDVAQAGNELLIEEQGLDGCGSAREHRAHPRGPHLERVRPDPQRIPHPLERGQVKVAETPRVHVPQFAAVVEADSGMAVAADAGGGLGIHARRRDLVPLEHPGAPVRTGHDEAARHPQVHHQGARAPRVIQRDQDGLSDPIHRVHPGPVDPSQPAAAGVV